MSRSPCRTMSVGKAAGSFGRHSKAVRPFGTGCRRLRRKFPVFFTKTERPPFDHADPLSCASCPTALSLSSQSCSDRLCRLNSTLTRNTRSHFKAALKIRRVREPLENALLEKVDCYLSAFDVALAVNLGRSDSKQQCGRKRGSSRLNGRLISATSTCDPFSLEVNAKKKLSRQLTFDL